MSVRELSAPSEIGPEQAFTLEGRRLDAELHARLYNTGVYGIFSTHENDWKLHLCKGVQRFMPGVVLKYHHTKSDAYEAFQTVCQHSTTQKRLAVLYLYCKLAKKGYTAAKEFWPGYSTSMQSFSPEDLYDLIFPPAEAVAQAALTALVHVAEAKKKQPALIEGVLAGDE